jgi:hypothetical protein
MSEHQREMEFLRPLIALDDSDERRKLEERIAQVHCDERCVQRAVSLMALFIALGAAAFGYVAVLQDNFPYGKEQFVLNIICELGLASVVCLLVFVSLLASYRKKLSRLREGCRRVVARLVESHVRKPHITALQRSNREAAERELAQGAVEVNAPSGRVDSSSAAVLTV